MDLDLPPRRPLPATTRARLRGAVMDRLDVPRRRQSGLRGPVAAAAAAAVLAFGAAMVLQSAQLNGAHPDKARPTSTSGHAEDAPWQNMLLSPPPLDANQARDDLDRCWNVVRGSANAGRYPDRALWKPVFAMGMETGRTTAFRAAGLPLFCEVTTTSATVSDPAAAAAVSKTPVLPLFGTPGGTIAGVLRPDTNGAMIDDSVGTFHRATDVRVAAGMFIWSSVSPPDTHRSIGQYIRNGRVEYSGASLPRPPDPGATGIDRPDKLGERSSARGRALGDCLSGAAKQRAVPDMAGWQPRAVISHDLANGSRSQLITATNAEYLALCIQDLMPDGPVFRDLYVTSANRLADDVHPVAWQTRFDRPGGIALVGTVLPTITRIEATVADGTKGVADVYQGMFALFVPYQPATPGGSAPKLTFQITAFDSLDQVLFHGPLNGY